MADLESTASPSEADRYSNPGTRIHLPDYQSGQAKASEYGRETHLPCRARSVPPRPMVHSDGLADPLTLRVLLAMSDPDLAFPPQEEDKLEIMPAFSQNFLQTRSPDNLDERLKVTHVPTVGRIIGQHYSAQVAAGRLLPGDKLFNLVACHVCGERKLTENTPRDPDSDMPDLEEFPLGSARVLVRDLAWECNCVHHICQPCIIKRIHEAAKRRWWFELGHESWFMCPDWRCGKRLPIRHAGDLSALLQTLRVHFDDLRIYMKMYSEALEVRKTIRATERSWTHQELLEGRDVYNRFVDEGISKDIFDDKTRQTRTHDVFGMVQEFRSVIGCLFRNQLFGVPVVMNFLNRAPTPTVCSSCGVACHEIDYKSVDKWIAVFENGTPKLSIALAWKLLTFPAKLGLHCRHEMDICKSCLREHIKSKVKELGVDGVDKIPCPSENCGRLLLHDEIETYADEKTFQDYDRLLALNQIRWDPNFRWCLRTKPTNCVNGAIYTDKTSYMRCSECAFEMCFAHQKPWHTGLSCDEYDSQQEHGDPSHKATIEWIHRQTKACPGPGCGQRIEKGPGCQHMTCPRCKFEFCWVCLADWKNIGNTAHARPGHYVYNREGHRPECYFRTAGAGQFPTRIMGADIGRPVVPREEPTPAVAEAPRLS